QAMRNCCKRNCALSVSHRLSQNRRPRKSPSEMRSVTLSRAFVSPFALVYSSGPATVSTITGYVPVGIGSKFPLAASGLCSQRFPVEKNEPRFTLPPMNSSVFVFVGIVFHSLCNYIQTTSRRREVRLQVWCRLHLRPLSVVRTARVQ